MKAKINNKKAIVALALLFGVSFGFMMTFAVNRDSATFNNNFGLAEWKTVFTEEFESPSNWTTCETVEKTITVKNESNIDAAVRIKIEEQWLKNDGTELPLMSAASGNQMAIINFTENSGWEKALDGYYYYNVDLHKNDETTSLTTSVTLNCDANLSIDADYAAATYHLKFTAQTIQYDQKSAWRTTLYDIVASQTKGLDSNIMYSVSPAIPTYNFYRDGTGWTYNNPGQGVFTYTPNASDAKPVYYYRGDVKNNHVIFADKCWHIVRTTSTGGVKLVYDSEIMMDGDNKTCSEYGEAVANSGFSDSTNTFPEVGYTYGSKEQTVYRNTMNMAQDTTTIYHYANDVKYENGEYTLIGVISGTYPSISSAVNENHHYYCKNNSDSVCPEVVYSYTGGNGFDITGYNNFEEKYRAVMIGSTPSAIKTKIDEWYEANMTQFTDKLEDTVFCNDRSLHDGPLLSKDNPVSKRYAMNAYWRAPNNDFDEQPILNCPRAEDAYTVEETNGNGLLTYPVALLTMDEAMLSGYAYHYNYSSKSSYLYNDRHLSYTMSAVCEYTACVEAYSNSGNYLGEKYAADSGYVQPAISLKPGTYYKSGDGTAGNPIIVE